MSDNPRKGDREEERGGKVLITLSASAPRRFFALMVLIALGVLLAWLGIAAPGMGLWIRLLLLAAGGVVLWLGLGLYEATGRRLAFARVQPDPEKARAPGLGARALVAARAAHRYRRGHLGGAGQGDGGDPHGACPGVQGRG